MRDRSDRYQVSAAQPVSPPKRLGGYLIEAGLITPDQVSVALSDQQATGMRFGEVLVARGWLKEQTVEWIMQKVIMPEKKAHQHHTSGQTVSQNQPAHQPSTGQGKTPAAQPAARTISPSRFNRFQPPPPSNAFSRREVPVAKPLPPVNASDEDVNWVG
jgi:hypothetical protein